MKLLQFTRRSFTQLTNYETPVIIETAETQKHQAMLRLKIEKIKQLQQQYLKMSQLMELDDTHKN
jgi:hypothetical protein